MSDLKIDRAELEKVLGLRIPESSTIEISITDKAKRSLKPSREEAAPKFQGRLVFEEGRLTEVKAINADKVTVDFYKSGPVGPCW
jgi:hypothetical protein